MLPSPRKQPGLAGAALLAVLPGCDAGVARPDGPARPNVVWIVWDTVRADRLGPYGAEPDPTPNLTRRSAEARVFDCTATSCWTKPTHASMFTGLFPSEHGVTTSRAVLAPEHRTVAEILRETGYATYLFSANPFVSSQTGLARGFDVQEHPFDLPLRQRALRMVRDRIGATVSSADDRAALEEGAKIWFVKDAGELANERFFDFLDERPADRPFFAFLNYMEAHHVRLPPPPIRERWLAPEDLAASFRIDQTQLRFQRLSLGLDPPLDADETRILRGLYAAALAELDALLESVFVRLERDGLLADSVVLLTSDHGEHLGERGNWLHHYSLYEQLVRVPLLLWAPGRLEAGREPRPVSGVDLFPTVLDAAGVPSPRRRGPVSLLGAIPPRPVVSEYPVVFEPILDRFDSTEPGWDSAPFRRALQVVRRGGWKLIRSSDGSVELFDLERDPGELKNLAAERPALVDELGATLDEWARSRASGVPAETPEAAPIEAEWLRALGYM